MSFLSVQAVSKRYGKVQAVDDISLDVVAGSRTAIVGPSGSGKTTLLRLIAGFETPDSGRIVLDGSIMADGSSAVPAHRRSIGIVAQDGALFPHLTVADNIGFGLERKTPDRDQRILALMDLVELARSMHDRRPHQLSGGQQQRVALARALARQPKLMLLDEPFSALDAGLREGIRSSVAEVLRVQKITAILVTHDQAEALSFADQVAILQGGSLLQAGTPRDVYLNPRDPATAAFLGDAIVLDATLEDGWASCVLGRVEVNSPRKGPAKIMLRPEQIVLTALSDTEAATRHGQITRIEFAGSVCSVTVSLADEQSLLIRTPSIQLPPVGSRVEITVLGQAHVFA
jgi:iron(III) transport system ATP-binding protein